MKKMLRVKEVKGEEASECSSGCESGWTMYLDQSDDERSATSPYQKKGKWGEEEEEGEEDLSMVSDASSGPPHFHEYDDPCYSNRSGENGLLCCSASSAAVLHKGGKRRRVEEEHQQQGGKEKACDHLDDTASSPIFSFSKTNINLTNAGTSPLEEVLELSYGFSATHFKGKSTVKNHFSHLKPTSAKP